MLGREGPLDFVKDCLAVLFITALHDLEQDEYKHIDQMMIILKFRLCMVAECGNNGNKPSVEEKDACVMTQEEIEYILEHAEQFDRLAKYKEGTVWDRMLEDSLGQHSNDEPWYQEVNGKIEDMKESMTQKSVSNTRRSRTCTTLL